MNVSHYHRSLAQNEAWRKGKTQSKTSYKIIRLWRQTKIGMKGWLQKKRKHDGIYVRSGFMCAGHYVW